MWMLLRAPDEGRHLGVPAVSLVTEVNASFQKLTHVERGKRHQRSPFPVEYLRGPL
jgi:hypothetical protein